MNVEFLFQRRHERYLRQLESWRRSAAAYSGGADYIAKALIRHLSEIEPEFLERRSRAYYFNYPRRIARLITQYALSVDPIRTGAAPELVEDFSRRGLRVNEVMRQFSTMLNVYGCAWMLIDMPNFAGEVDLDRRNREKLRPYATVLAPTRVTDWSYHSDGELEWAVIEEECRCAADPFQPAVRKIRRKLFTRETWLALEREASGGPVRIVGEGTHHLGVVPLIYAEEVDGFGMAANHWFEDVVRISDAIMNNESEAQMNIIKQLFGLLVISDSFARGARAAERQNGRTDGQFSHVIARSAAIVESPEERGISRYIAPGGAETAEIRAENLTLKREMFEVVGMSLAKETRATESAESKAWDQQLLRQFLASRSELLEQSEIAAWKMMRCYDPSIPLPTVSYNRDFSVVDLKESVEALLGLNKITAGLTYRREIARTAVSLLEKFKKISPDDYQQVLKEISEIEKFDQETADV